MNEKKRTEETEFFTQLPVVFGNDGYAITPELLEYVSQNPHIGTYNWNAGLQAFQPYIEVDNALKSITQAQIEQLKNEEPLTIARRVVIQLNADGTININGQNDYFFYKTPKSRIEKNIRAFTPTQRRIFRKAREAVAAAAREREGDAMVLDEDEELSQAIGALQVEENGNGGGGKVVKRRNINQDEEIAAALAKFNLDDGDDLFGGKSRRKTRKTKRTRKSNKSKKSKKSKKCKKTNRKSKKITRRYKKK
jgi:hypothetical protein